MRSILALDLLITLIPTLHESGTFVKFTDAGAALFA